jgi:predicted MPP superfamily phosphohydrolase
VRIVQLSDIHLEHPTRREADILRQIQALQPDLIVITGDFLNTSFLNNPQSQAELHDWLSNLSAPAGVWAVNGTTDNPDVLRRIFSGTSVTLLDDAVQRVDVGGGQLTLLGVTDVNLDRDGQMLAALLGGLRTDEFSLLLYHNPDLIGSARKRNVDLYLAGHTHGGQVRLPFYGALVTDSAFGKQFEMGLYYQLNTTLYINRGLGMEGSIAPRARLLCPPEIVVIDLQP